MKTQWSVTGDQRPVPAITQAIDHRPQATAVRLFLFVMLLFAFGRLMWELGEKPLWWDESLSLQRSEQSWPDLLVGLLVITDGESQHITRDQHPFVYYIFLKLFQQVWGTSEFVLRLPSALAGTLLVPALWSFARLFVRTKVYPRMTSEWVALLAAINPFYLWYGQEARPYILWTLLAVLSTYALLRWQHTKGEDLGVGTRNVESVHEETTTKFSVPQGERVLATNEFPRPTVFWPLAYGMLTLFALFTHFFSGLLVLVHGLILTLGLWQPARRLAIGLGIIWFLAVAALGAGIAWWVLSQPGAGTNFQQIHLYILARDLLNAFSLGLSVDIREVLALDILFGLLALVGAVYGLRVFQRFGQGGLRAQSGEEVPSLHAPRTTAIRGWQLPTLLVVPVLLLFLGNLIQPLYMNARHLALLSGFYLLLVAAGLAVLATRSFIAAGLVSLLLIGGSTYSTINYFTLPIYRKGPELAQMGADLRQDLHPGDLLLLDSPFAWRFFHYYLPIAQIDALSPHVGTAWRAVPLVGAVPGDWPKTFDALATWSARYRRIWLATESTYDYLDPERRVKGWLQDNHIRIWEKIYFSPTSRLELELFLTGPPIVDVLPPNLDARPNVVFADRIVLRGLAVEPPLFAESMTPITLYWDPLTDLERHFKYVLWIEELLPTGEVRRFPRTEQEPYRGFVPTDWWRPGPLVLEFSDVVAPMEPTPAASYRLHLFWYDAETLEKLPVTDWGDATAAEDGVTLTLPFPLPIPNTSETPNSRD